MARRNRKNRKAKAGRLRDPGPDASGNYDVSPYAARGHLIEVAPKELRSNPNSAAFPKRVATQRMIDRYFKAGHITIEEYRAATHLWSLWDQLGMHAKVTSGYDPVMVSSSPSMDSKVAKWLDAALAVNRLLKAIPYHAQGVVRAVVIEDRSAADWAIERRRLPRAGIVRLRAGLTALATHLGH